MLTAVESPVRIQVLSVHPSGAPGRWRVAWLISNLQASPVRLEDAWVPHGRFRGEGHVAVDRAIDPGQSWSLELNVRAEEPAGTVVDNAFLIVRLRSGAVGWRVFARMRIEFPEASRLPTPRPVVEAVTAQSLE
jgi:hypothetical protein